MSKSDDWIERERAVPVDDQLVHERLRAAFEGRRCVSAWLGYADVAFLGFGSEQLARPKPSERHPLPPYELETNYASWRVEGTIAVDSSDDRLSTAELTSAAESLVGQAVVGWQLVAGITLRVMFTGDKTLTVVPWSGEGVSHAWSLSAPDGKILAAGTDGRLVVVASSMPGADWVT